jgi:hypothetical protein
MLHIKELLLSVIAPSIAFTRVIIHAIAASARPDLWRWIAVGTQKDWEPVFVHRLVFDVTVPTGTYSDRQPVNIGNHFVVAPYLPFEGTFKLLHSKR